MKITLINGPYDKTQINDSGTVLIKMGIKNKKTNYIGDAIYEPDENRIMAHWLENRWLGILQNEIKIDDGDWEKLI